MYILKFILFLAFSCQVFSFTWKEKVETLKKEFSIPFENGNVATLQGSCHAPDYDDDELPGRKVSFNITDSNYLGGEVRVRGIFQEKINGELKKAPLFLFIPGAFSNHDIGQTRRHLHDLGKLGYHVIVFPNPWGTDFISGLPKEPIGDILFEGEVMYSLLKKTIERLLYEGVPIKETHLMGVSYGSFVAAMISTFNARESNPLNLKDTTIISPPIIMSKALLGLDNMIKVNRWMLQKNLVSVYRIFRRMCALKTDKNLPISKIRQADGLVIRGGFFDRLIESVLKYDELFNLNKVPDRKWGLSSKKYRNWKRNFSFSNYFKTFAPKNLDIINSEYGNLYYWINQSRSLGDNSIRVLLSDDDFLNQKEDIPYYDESTVVLNNGGHFGIRYTLWYQKFLFESFTL